MVSFFGLKIGGDKKKKPSKDLQISSPQAHVIGDANAVDSDLFDFKGVPNPSYEASVYSLSRQETGQSTLSKRGKFKGLRAPFASNKFGSSMVDLPTPPSLRHHASNPSIGRRWNTGSSTSLSLAPPSFNPMTRPSTSDGKSRPWVNPLDVHFSRDSSKPGFKGPLSPASTARDDVQPSTPLSATPKSPLGQYELKLDLPDDVASFADLGDFQKTVEAPAPLRIKKMPSTRLAAEPRAESQAQKPPSPPQSIVGRDMSEKPGLEPPKLPTAEILPSSIQSHHDVSSGLEELQNAISNFEPTSLPSPSATPRVSEEKPSTTAVSARPSSPSAKRGNPKPIIQNVRAKRDTLTINPQRRRSLQMKIEAAEGVNVPSLSLTDRPKTSGNGRDVERPPPLTLNMGFRLGVDGRDGPQSASFLPNPMRSTTPASLKPPSRPQLGIQVDFGRQPPTRQASEKHSRADSLAGSSVYDDDDDAYHHPLSPESTSPVIPLTGPLASPRFPPSSQSPYSCFGTCRSPGGDATGAERDISPTTPPVPPRSLRRNPPTPDSSHWPVPSPIVPSFDRAAVSPSPADSRLQSESGSELSFAHEPLEPPRIPAARSGAESPTFRSFSRPWTPTATGEFAAPSLKRAETTGLRFGPGSGSEFGGGLRPPPRSVTVKTPRTTSKALENQTPRAGENGSSGGFI